MEKGLKKVFSAMGAVFCAVMMIMLCQVTNAVSYSEQTVTVDYDYQVIDSFEGVDAKYVLGYSDTGYYCCAGYVSRFYEEKFGVTVYNINMVDDKLSCCHCKGLSGNDGHAYRAELQMDLERHCLHCEKQKGTY